MPSEEGLNNPRAVLNIPFENRFLCFSFYSPENISWEGLHCACLLLLFDRLISRGHPHSQYRLLLLGSCWRPSQFQNLNRIPPSKNQHFLWRFEMDQNLDALSLHEHFCPGMCSYFSSSLMARVQSGIEMTYLITSSIRCVCVPMWASLPIYYAALKQHKNPHCMPLALSCPCFPLRLAWGHGKLQPQQFSVIFLDQQPLGLLGAHYIYGIYIIYTDLNQESWRGSYALSSLRSPAAHKYGSRAGVLILKKVWVFLFEHM